MNALSKSSLASFKVRKVLETVGTVTENSRKVLYDAYTKSTILYGSEVWGLQQEDTLERGQTDFFKQLFFLQRSTPGYVIRQEFGLAKLVLEVVRRAVSWFSKVNSMSKSRLPRLCLDRQLSLLDRRRDGQSWAQKLRGWFWEGGDYDGWNRLTAGTYNGDDLNDLILRLHVARRGRDRGRVLYSSHCPIYKFYANSGRKLLESSSLPIGRIRVFYQLITINNKFQSIYWQGETSKFFPANPCLLCGEAKDSLEHFFIRCPLMKKCRYLHRMAHDSSIGGIEQDMANLLHMTNNTEISRMWSFLRDAMRVRGLFEQML